MTFDFDVEKIQREMEKRAEEAYLNAVDRAKRSLGIDGGEIVVRRRSAPLRQGTELTFGDMSFPNEDVRRRFEEALRRELR